MIDAHGKSTGEVALHWPERRILVVGDACVGKPPGSCALLSPQVIDDLPALQSSLRRIAAEVDFDVLLLCDGAPILDGPVSSIRWEMLREGIEDYELLWLLRDRLTQRRADLAPDRIREIESLLEVPESITTNMTTFTADPAPILERRAAIAKAIESLGP